MIYTYVFEQPTRRIPISKNTRIKLTLPLGEARYPKLNKPDTKFNPEGEYKTDLLYSPDDPKVKAVIQKLEDLAADFAENHEKDGETIPVYRELEDGRIMLRVKQKAFEYKGEKHLPQPLFFDAKGKRIETGVPNIYGGSKLVVGVEAVPFATQETVRENGKRITVTSFGVTMRPKAVQ
ncbi:hypothetical protein EHW61_16930, partial [Salinivibrio sp. VYel6]|uniref:hypothetical protein n=1 Tax=Salinivibrio sp. VYel6 TaxID=2490493 RepID=UPI001C12B86F